MVAELLYSKRKDALIQIRAQPKLNPNPYAPNRIKLEPDKKPHRLSAGWAQPKPESFFLLVDPEQSFNPAQTAWVKYSYDVLKISKKKFAIILNFENFQEWSKGYKVQLK